MFLNINGIISFLLQYKYYIVFPIVMIEGPITTIILGFLASNGYFNLIISYFLAVIADLTSDIFYYLFGYWGGKNLIEKYGHYFGISKLRFEKLKNNFNNNVGKMLIFGKIVDPLSSTIQTIAGITRVPFSKFIYYNIISTFPKSLILILSGFYFGSILNEINFYRKLLSFLLALFFLIILAFYFVYKFKKQREIDSEFLDQIK
jgi:membrane protein DedA with SNARE-associated domain